MRTLKCIIVEDEPLAAEVIRDYLSQVPQLELVGEFEDAIFALEGLQRIQVDVIFLDLHMPKLKGLEFLKVLKNPPQVIITTAYDEYALEGYNLDVVDYLLKPIEFERFLQAVHKLSWHSDEITKADAPVEFRYFRVNRMNYRVNLNDILFIESLKDYVRIHTTGGSFITKEGLGSITESLDDISVIRIHRSYAVAKKHIEAFTGSEVIIGGNRIPIGRSYREFVKKELN